jgi:DUF4097 and DUF4098 domain-containing protein YvlB
MKHLILILSLILIANGQEKTIKKEFDKASKIRIEIRSGDVDMVKSSDGKIHIEVKHTYDEDDFKPVIEKRGNSIVIKERDKQFNFSWNNRNRGESYWMIQIPDGMEIEHNSGSGDFTIADLKFEEFEGNTGSGDFKFEKTAGELKLNAGSGDMTFKTHEGDIETNTGSGDINVRNSKGEVRINTGSGDIEAEKTSGSFRMNTGSGNIELSGVEITGRSSMNSGSGDIEVMLSGTLQDDLDMNSGSGDVILDFNGTDISAYFEFKARYENRIKTPFSYEKEEKVERYGNEYYLKTAEVGGMDVNVHMASGSGVVQVKK